VFGCGDCEFVGLICGKSFVDTENCLRCGYISSNDLCVSEPFSDTKGLELKFAGCNANRKLALCLKD
jgi:hypothetical protein